MVIYTLCINPSDGVYIAFTGTDPLIKELSYVSHAEAIGKLMLSTVKNSPVLIINVDNAKGE